MPQATTIGGAIVAVLFIVGMYFFLRYRSANSEENKKAAEEFLNSLSGQIETMLLEIFTKINIKDYKTLEELEAAIFNMSYEKIWTFIEAQIKEAVDNKTISTVIGALVTRENVEALIDVLIKRTNILQRAEAQWAVAMSSGYKEAEKFEEEVVAKNEKYTSGTVDVSDYTPEEYDKDPMKTGIIPVKDEEESYNAADDSMEIIPDSVEEIEEDKE